MAKQPYIDDAFLTFLTDLRRHNKREWFQTHKARYEASVRDPFLRLIDALCPRLGRFEPPFDADAKPTGGSMMRIYRDIRFSPDKSPYKTAVAAHFGLARGSRESGPGFYLHIEPGKSMLGGGVWRPDTKVVARIRDHIVAEPERWKRATTGRGFQSLLQLSGESVKRMPRGYDANHPLADDLRRKDFIFTAPLDDDVVVSSKLLDTIVNRYERALPMMRFLIDATTAAS